MSDPVELLLFVLFAILVPWGIDRSLRDLRPPPPDNDDVVYPPRRLR